MACSMAKHPLISRHFYVHESLSPISKAIKQQPGIRPRPLKKEGADEMKVDLLRNWYEI